jgi:hypothetical protein
MTLTAVRDTKESALLLDGILSFPMAAATTIFAGDVVCTDASGNAVALTASTALRAWGRAERTVINTVPAGFGAAGALRIDAKRGVYGLPNGAGADVINASHVGRLAYGGPAATANLTDGGGLRPALGKIYGLLGSDVLVGIGEPSLYDIADDVVGGSPNAIKTARARNVVNGNVADLAAYVVASDATLNDATAGVAGNVVLLIAQTTAAQNGLYVIGTVAGGLAPLTRIAPMPTGYAFLAGEFDIAVASGTVFGNTKWFNSAAGTVGTNDPATYPEKVTISQALVAGTFTITSIPVLSVTKSFVGLTRRIANTSSLTIMYCTTSAGANGVTAGAIGTASVIVQACVAAGTINSGDISTLEFSVHNR